MIDLVVADIIFFRYFRVGVGPVGLNLGRRQLGFCVLHHESTTHVDDQELPLCRPTMAALLRQIFDGRHSLVIESCSLFINRSMSLA